MSSKFSGLPRRTASNLWQFSLAAESVALHKDPEPGPFDREVKTDLESTY